MLHRGQGSQSHLPPSMAWVQGRAHPRFVIKTFPDVANTHGVAQPWSTVTVITLVACWLELWDELVIVIEVEYK